MKDLTFWLNCWTALMLTVAAIIWIIGRRKK